jgi:hypothetical protein
VTRRVAAAVAAVALVLLAGCGPKGKACQDGSSLYSSEYGDFVCVDGRWVEA